MQLFEAFPFDEATEYCCPNENHSNGDGNARILIIITVQCDRHARIQGSRIRGYRNKCNQGSQPQRPQQKTGYHQGNMDAGCNCRGIAARCSKIKSNVCERCETEAKKIDS